MEMEVRPVEADLQDDVKIGQGTVGSYEKATPEHRASSKIACHRLSDNAYVPGAGWARFWIMSLTSTDTIPVNDYGK
jgi:hypothetical protein